MTYIQSTLKPSSSSLSHHTKSPSPKQSTSFNSSSYTSSPIRHSPLSQPPILAYGISRTPSSIYHSNEHDQNGSRPIPTPNSTRIYGGGGRRRSSLSPLTSLVSPSLPNLPIHDKDSPRTPPRDTYFPSDTPRNDSSPASLSPTQSPSPSLSRSHPLLGSYHLSLLHSRMSHAHQPHESNQVFSLNMISMGKGKSCPGHLRCTKSIEIPISAIYFDLEDTSSPSDPTFSPSSGMGSGSTPWTSTLNLEEYYFNLFSSSPHTSHSVNGNENGVEDQPPRFPGYQVSPVGQLQILIKTKDSPIKVFLIPYDLRKVPIGGRMLVREKTYFKASSSYSVKISEGRNENKGILKYAIQLQFVCVPSPTTDRDQGDEEEEFVDNPYTTRNQRIRNTTKHPHSQVSSSLHSPSPFTINANRNQEGKSYYVSKSLKLVFVSTPPDISETMEIERTDEIIEPPLLNPYMTGCSKKRRNSANFAFSPGSLGKTSEDWEITRSKWLAKRGLQYDSFSPSYQDSAPRTGNQRHAEPNVVPDRRSEKLDFGITDKPKMIRKPSLISATLPALSPTAPFPPSSSALTSAPLSHKPILSPIPILSPLPMRSGTINRSSRPSTPTSPRPISPYAHGHGHEPALIWSPKSQRRMRREDGLEEFELSEKLRRMELGSERE